MSALWESRVNNCIIILDKKKQNFVGSSKAALLLTQLSRMFSQSVSGDIHVSESMLYILKSRICLFNK